MTHYSNTANPVDFPKLGTVDRLWGEALDRAVPDTYSTPTWTQVERIKTVFAELIVQECIKVVGDGRFSDTECEGNSHRVSYNNGRYGASSDIKKHFRTE